MPPEFDLLVADARVLRPDGAGARLERADLAIKDGRIVRLAPPGSLARRAASELIAAGGGLAMPGLVNAHTHSPENLAPVRMDGGGVAGARYAAGAPRPARDRDRRGRNDSPWRHIGGRSLSTDADDNAGVDRGGRGLCREHAAAGDHVARPARRTWPPRRPPRPRRVHGRGLDRRTRRAGRAADQSDARAHARVSAAGYRANRDSIRDRQRTGVSDVDDLPFAIPSHRGRCDARGCVL